ncbi:MAG: tetratricopeptide repeat protein, partial [Verrucomicrobiales bacterium]
ALEQPLSPAQAEDIDYIAVWIEHSAGDLEAAVSLGRYFLDKWPTSRHVPKIHLMLGEMYFRNREYPGAIAQFEVLAKKEPLSEHAETALFFAGKAARLMMSPDSTDRAIDSWSRVVDMNGELALAAREEQALAKLGVGQEADAVTVLDTILEGDPPATGELLFSVLCSKGQALFIMAGEHGEALKEAIASFDAVLAHPEATPFWRNQAALRRAKCLERKGEPAAALEQYLDVIQGSHAVPPEYLWHYRAGFEAIRMLESQEEWEKAIEVAEHLARGGGSRSEEAAARANRLRLQHFIWKE